MERKSLFGWHYINALVILILVLTVIGVSTYAFRQMDTSLYCERVSNSNLLMEKISQNMQTGMKGIWDHAETIARAISDDPIFSLEDAVYALSREEAYQGSTEKRIFLVDENGRCYASDGTTFWWEDLSMLTGNVHEVYVSTLPALGIHDLQTLFLTPFPQHICVGDITFTHVCLSCGMSYFDTFFDTEAYGENSVAFVIHANGTQVYRKENASALANVYNVVSALERCVFRYDGSVERLKQDLDGGIAGCQYVEYEGKPYFVSYRSLSINDWIAIIMVPEEDVGENTTDFMRSIILSVGAVCLVTLLALVSMILMSNHVIRQKQNEANRMLRLAAEAERNASIAKTRFLSSMSHDIRTPMNAITGMVTIAERHLNDPEQIRECLRKISLASGHLLNLINDILDISKVESGKMVLNPVAFSVQACVENLTNIVRPQAVSKALTFDVKVHNILSPYILADEVRVNQVYINILTNSVKYTPSGGSVTMELCQEAVEDCPERVRMVFSVADTGIGMSPEFQATMYESFSRASDDNRVHKIQGTGLGLSICKQMTELMGGTIRCDSAVNRGTCFTITLEFPVAPIPEEISEGPDDGADLSGMRLLIAEDNDLNWEIIQEILDFSEIYADRAENGKECVEKMESAEEGLYDMVLMDVQMPVMNGHDATRALRCSSRAWVRTIPIIAMTADAFAEDIQACMDSGMDGYVAKPVELAKLFHELRKFREKESSSGKENT